MVTTTITLIPRRTIRIVVTRSTGYVRMRITIPNAVIGRNVDKKTWAEALAYLSATVAPGDRLLVTWRGRVPAGMTFDHNPPTRYVMQAEHNPTRFVIDEDEEERAHCCACPHEVYLTTSVSKHEHRCESCGATFIDARREKRYFGHAPQ